MPIVKNFYLLKNIRNIYLKYPKKYKSGNKQWQPVPAAILFSGEMYFKQMIVS